MEDACVTTTYLGYDTAFKSYMLDSDTHDESLQSIAFVAGHLKEIPRIPQLRTLPKHEMAPIYLILLISWNLYSFQS